MKPDRSEPLSDRELAAWLDFWTLHLVLPTRLDAQLKRESGLSHIEFAVLAKLSVTDGYRKRMSELAVDTGSTLSHLSRVINRLEDRGHARRVPDTADGRATLVELADIGHAMVGRSTGPTRRNCADWSSTPSTSRNRSSSATSWAGSRAPCGRSEASGPVRASPG